MNVTNSDTSTDLSESDVYALLAHRRRRLVLRLLQDFSPPLTAREVAKLIAECVYEEPPTDRQQSIYLSLHHTHLPKLADANVVSYCADEGTISPASNYGTVLGALETNERDPSFPRT